MKTKFALLLATTLTISLHAQVLPKDAVVDGRTIGEWSAEWFQSFYALGTNVSPMFDPDGRSATNGQPAGAVFFLGSGTGFETAPIHRTFFVPEEKYLFVPLLVATVDNIDTDPPLTVEEMRDGITAFINDPRELHANIDGVDVPNLLQHRAATPVFSVEYTNADNYLTVVYGHPIVGLVDPVVGDGYWLMIEPLAPGPHVLRYGGAYGLPFYFPTDITANITVVPAPLEQKVEELLSKLKTANIPAKRKHALRVALLKAGASFENGKLRAGIDHLRAFQHQVRAQLSRHYPDLAQDLINRAKSIIERARQDLPRGNRGDDDDGDDDDDDDEDD